MELNLCKYAKKKICVAVSGGKDSMALLHYLSLHAKEHSITLSALNCDHKIRGEASARDSEFVKEWCIARKIPLIFFERSDTCAKFSETDARLWRLKCYLTACKNSANFNETDLKPAQIYTPDREWYGADAVATAHHLNDNAETVLFNLARGSALSGLGGITDYKFPASDGANLSVIHPMISCSRGEIDEYIDKNNIAFVEDETNFTDDYTRNKIRHNVLPELEKAVPQAAKAIYRFSRLAAEDEQYFNNLIDKNKIITQSPFGKQIAFCEERAVFKRAAIKVVKDGFNKKDYTSEHAENLYKLQYAQNGKKFEFLGLTAYKQDGKIVIDDNHSVEEATEGRLFKEHISSNCSAYAGQFLVIACENEYQGENVPERTKVLKFDYNLIPETAVIRCIKAGDRFKKFGGGTKNLGDYFTDLKIPANVRSRIPLVACDSEILAVCGVEISDKIKITDKTKNVWCIVCADYRN